MFGDFGMGLAWYPLASGTLVSFSAHFTVVDRRVFRAEDYSSLLRSFAVGSYRRSYRV